MAEIEQPQTEEEAREANVKLKKLLRWSPLLYTPIVGLFLWLIDAPYWYALVGAFLLFELATYPFVARSLDRNLEIQIAAIRERDELTQE